MSRKSITIALVICVLAAARQADAGIIVGMVSDFQTGTRQGWRSGSINPNPPTVLFDGHGPGDHALEVVGTGVNGPGGKVVTYNRLSQWTGDYLSAGVTSISMDLNNVGLTDLDIRLGINGPGGRYATNIRAFLSAGSGWANFVLPTGIADCTPDGGFNLNATLSSVSEIRILNSPTPSFDGLIEAGDLLIDNITAIPEPSSLALLAILGLAVRRRALRSLPSSAD